MSKSKKNFRYEDRDYSEDNELDSSTQYFMDKEKRKNKRLVNVLRSKNIADLLEMEEDE